MSSKITNDDIQQKEPVNMDIPYVVAEILIAICTILGNLLVIIIFCRERKSRRRSDYFIISLAIADLLVGLVGIPIAVLISVNLPNNNRACMFLTSTLIATIYISVHGVVALSVDRFWAVVLPLDYSQNNRSGAVIFVIVTSWLIGITFGYLPMMGWNSGYDEDICAFHLIMNYEYLVFHCITVFVIPNTLLCVAYGFIYKVIVGLIRKKNSIKAKDKREVDLTMNLTLIIIFFIICGLPLHAINTFNFFCDNCYQNFGIIHACIALSHLNSAINPIIYAFRLKEFRNGVKKFFCRSFHDVYSTAPIESRSIGKSSKENKVSKGNIKPEINIMTSNNFDSGTAL